VHHFHCSLPDAGVSPHTRLKSVLGLEGILQGTWGDIVARRPNPRQSTRHTQHTRIAVIIAPSSQRRRQHQRQHQRQHRERHWRGYKRKRQDQRHQGNSEKEEEKEEQNNILALVMMESDASILPAPRALLTSLINTFTSLPVAAQSTQPAKSASRSVQAQDATSPLALLPSNSRTLITTLHVIYPSLLLPALDLLDRGLVTRVLVLDNSTPASVQSPPLVSSAEAEIEQARRDARAASFHLVRSAQQQPARRGRRPPPALLEDAGRGPTYLVCTQAWSCDCAAFAFGAFPAVSGEKDRAATAGYQIRPADDDAGGGNVEHALRGGAHGWEFGGLSLDSRDDGTGVASGTPPCCKHLLACVLAERWGSVLGDYVQERKVGREEAAGLIGSL
jgi:hypothetical protein